jgi:DNA-directed RNA polymerase specialized sigma24 family protein
MGRDAVAADEAFTSFVATTEPRLRRALVAGFGPEVGADASAEAMAFAWQNWDRVRVKPNPVGYLFGVGRNQARRHRVDRVGFTLRPPEAEPWVEPGLAAAVASLSERQ